MAQRGRIPRGPRTPGDRRIPMGGPALLRQLLAFRSQVRRVAAERHPSWVVVQCEAVTDIDVPPRLRCSSNSTVS